MSMPPRPRSVWSVDWQQAEEQERSLVAEAVAGFAEEYPTVDVRRHVVRGHPWPNSYGRARMRHCSSWAPADAGVVKAMVLGSVSQGVLHDAHCPVAVIPSSDGPQPDRVRTSQWHDFHLPVPPCANASEAGARCDLGLRGGTFAPDIMQRRRITMERAH